MSTPFPTIPALVIASSGIVILLTIGYFQARITASRFTQLLETALAAQKKELGIDLIHHLEKTKFGRYTLSFISKDLIARTMSTSET